MQQRKDDMDLTQRIRTLPKEISDKIAAGEVVERPLSIVKELLENAIDAGAASIVVEIQNGGKTYVRLTDNGCGIPARDAALVFQRYATSKITTAEDLASIQTLGFRGEALASIAAVSRVELITKTTQQKTGVKITVEGGNVTDMEETGAEDGTTIIVSDLFFNTPVRKKFLKPDRTESALIVDYLSKMALAYPNIRMRLIHNGTILFSTQGKGNVLQNILTVYSRQTANGLIPVQGNQKERGYALSGYVSRPDQSRSNRKHLIYFVNGRWIRSPLIDDVLREAYTDKLFAGRYPAAFLFLRIPPDRLDVNIHPHKTEIKFLDEQEIRTFMVQSIRQNLLSEDAAPNMARYLTVKSSRRNQSDDKEETVSQIDIKHISLNDERTHYETVLSEIAPEESAGRNAPADKLPGERFLFSELRILGCVFAGYIVAQGSDTLYMIDQHAAHERILFEKLRGTAGGKSPDAQMMITPILMEIPLYLREEAPERLTLLMELGYHIEEFGPKEYIIKEIPALMDPSEAEAFLNDVLNNEPGTGRTEPKAEKERLIMHACKAAVKVANILDIRELESLLRALDETENPFTCPHGRPTFLRFSQRDIEKLFLRK